MRILLDVMGGDHPPKELVKGGIEIGRLRNLESHAHKLSKWMTAQ